MPQERIHDQDRDHQHRQIDDPVAVGGEAVVAQREGNLRKKRHQHRMQRERAEVEAEQLGIDDHAHELTGRDVHAGRCVVGIGHHVADHGDRRNGQDTGQREDAGHADPGLQHRAGDERCRKCQGDRDADRRHRARAHAIAGQVRRQRDDGRRDRPGALQATARDDPGDRRGPGGEEASAGKEGEPHVNHRLASPSVGGPAERYLEDRLREPVGAERDADQRVARAAGKILRVQREHRQDHEHAEKAKPVDAGEAGGGVPFGGRHPHARRVRRGGIRHGQAFVRLKTRLESSNRNAIY